MEPPLPPSRLGVVFEESLLFSRDLAIEAASEPPLPEVVVLQEALEAYFKSREKPAVPVDVFLATDRCCLQRLRGMLLAGGVRCDLEGLRRYGFPRTAQGRQEYMHLLAHFDPLSWNPSVWEVLCTLGPEEMVQEWRAIWLQSFSEREYPAGPPKAVLKGKEHLSGYARLKALFGEKSLEAALDSLLKCCKIYPPSRGLLSLWVELASLLVPPSPLDVRDNPLIKKYGELCAEYHRRISPLVGWDKKLTQLLKAEDWEGILVLDSEVSSKHPGLIAEFLWHLENALSQLFFDPIGDLPKLQSIFSQFRSKILDMMVARPSGLACKGMIRLCDNLAALVPFIRAFNPPTDRDWLLAFVPGTWSRCFTMLNAQLREGCANLLNRRLPVCTNSLSYYAWNRALRLLQDNESNPQHGILEIEQALQHTSELATPTLMDPEWRGPLGQLLPSSPGPPEGYSLMQGAVTLHLMLKRTLKPGGGCSIKKDPHHSHPVEHLQDLGVPSVFYKWEPRAFGIQWIDHCLFHFVLGGHTPSLDFVMVAGRRGFFQLSEPIPGIPLSALLQDPSRPPPRIEPQSYSENIVRLFLTCESDGKSLNYQATPEEGTPFYRLTIVDGELALNRPYVFHRKSGQPRLEVILASILLCFDQLRDPLDLAVADKLKNLDIHAALKQTLIACKQARRRLLACVEETEESQAWERSDPRYLSISIQLRHLEHWYNTLWRLQRLLGSPEIPTHLQLLEALFPPIADLVKQAHALKLSPEERFNHLFAQKYKVLSTLHNGQSRKILLTQHSRNVLVSCLSETSQTKFSPLIPSMSLDDALKYLDEIHAEGQQIAHIRSELDNGNLAPFCAIKLQLFREEVLWGSTHTDRIQWDKLSPPLVRRILTAMQGFSYRQLYLANCANATEALPSLFRNSPQLEVIDLTGLQAGQAIDFPPSAELRELNLSKTNIGLLKGHFPHLTTLTADESNIASIDMLIAPHLALISLNRCYALEKLWMRPHPSCRIASTGCRLEAAAKAGVLKSGYNLSYFYKGYQVEADLSLTSKGADGETLFNTCVAMNLIDQVTWILDNHQQDNWAYGKEHRSPLHVALVENKDNMVLRLASCTGYSLAEDRQNKTPLMVAATEGNINYVRLLLEGLNLQRLSTVTEALRLTWHYAALSYMFNKAMACAAQDNHSDIIALLCNYAKERLRASWSINRKLSGETAALEVALRGNHVESTKLLLAEGAIFDTNIFGDSLMRELLAEEQFTLPMLALLLGIGEKQIKDFVDELIENSSKLATIKDWVKAHSTVIYLKEGSLQKLMAETCLASAILVRYTIASH